MLDELANSTEPLVIISYDERADRKQILDEVWEKAYWWVNDVDEYGNAIEWEIRDADGNYVAVSLEQPPTSKEQEQLLSYYYEWAEDHGTDPLGLVR